jgi:precorrin-6Y C5,15-methyltransferase (decarboxylating)
VEHREEEIANIKENICRFNLFNIVPIAGRAVDHMAWLPAPERVFIGGSDGEMEAIITESAARLPENGRLVVNGVTEKTVTETPQLMKKYGFTVETTTIEVARSGPDGPIRFNPITIMVGRK